jgi:hypothetical protein
MANDVCEHGAVNRRRLPRPLSIAPIAVGSVTAHTVGYLAFVGSGERDDDVAESSAEADRDVLLETLLGQPVPAGRALRGAVREHIDAWEFEVFPQIVLAADPDELEEAARAAATARAG